MQFDYLREAFTLHDIPMDEKLNIEALSTPPEKPFYITASRCNNTAFRSSISIDKVQYALSTVNVTDHQKKYLLAALAYENCGFRNEDIGDLMGCHKTTITLFKNHHEQNLQDLQYHVAYLKCKELINSVQTIAA